MKGDEGFARALLAWYDRDARDLPWRRTRDPYRILVSEFMLQQTQVQTVIPYYERFLERFPDAASLASAAEDEVLRVWKGLGYYRRAQNLHKSARAIQELFGGWVPPDFDALRALPGVGEYTAAAVTSIAFGLPHPVLDGNVARVVARYDALEDPIDQQAVKRRMLERLRQLLPPERAGDFNQAMMELGARVCVPRQPRCGECPLNAGCRARASGRQAELPVKARREKVTTEERTVAVLRLGGRVLVVQRPAGGLLARMWEFPHVAGSGAAARAALWGRLKEHVGALSSDPGALLDPDALRWIPRGKVEHRFSHLLWRLDVYECGLRVDGVAEREIWFNSDQRMHQESTGVRWEREEDVGALALARAMQRVWERCSERGASGGEQLSLDL